ncbi:MAG: hypothetical protein DRR06_14915 [Gammaproteobacteria bacterium]|nr:MAG: hypothetical protein DRR06_14915 [Gammaproteobacteria bacterium]
MSVTFSKLATRLHPKLEAKGVKLEQEDTQEIIRLCFQEIGISLATGEDVFLEGFGRFYPDYKPARKVKSNLTKAEHTTKKKVFVRFSAFAKLTQRVQKYLNALGLDIQEEV